MALPSFEGADRAMMPATTQATLPRKLSGKPDSLVGLSVSGQVV
jgi:hypothetical protein